MEPYLLSTAVGALIGMVSVGVPGFLFFRLREKGFQKVNEAYERIVEKSDARLASVMDRLHATKNLPPEKVDMAELHQERREEEKERQIERRNGGPIPIPSRIGLVDRVQAQMEAGVKTGRYSRLDS